MCIYILRYSRGTGRPVKSIISCYQIKFQPKNTSFVPMTSLVRPDIMRSLSQQHLIIYVVKVYIVYPLK